MRIADHPRRPGRITVHQDDADFLTWRVTLPYERAGDIWFATHDEAIHFPHDWAATMIQAIQDGAA